MWWRMLHRGEAPAPNVRGAMEKDKLRRSGHCTREYTTRSSTSTTNLYQHNPSRDYGRIQVDDELIAIDDEDVSQLQASTISQVRLRFADKRKVPVLLMTICMLRNFCRIAAPQKMLWADYRQTRKLTFRSNQSRHVVPGCWWVAASLRISLMWSYIDQPTPSRPHLGPAQRAQQGCAAACRINGISPHSWQLTHWCNLPDYTELPLRGDQRTPIRCPCYGQEQSGYREACCLRGMESAELRKCSRQPATLRTRHSMESRTVLNMNDTPTT
eukprot:3383104-Rhodomonas_salina.1